MESKNIGLLTFENEPKFNLKSIRCQISIIRTVDTIRRWAPKRISSTLYPLLDDIESFAMYSLMMNNDDLNEENFPESIVRILDYLIKEAIENNNINIADELSKARQNILDKEKPKH